MKFSQSLKINVIPDWSDNYIAYSSLKKTIYQLEKDLQNLNDKNDVEQPLLNQADDINDDDLYVNPTCKLFGNLLINEIERITKFYKEKEIEFYAESQNLFNSINKIESSSNSRFRFNTSDSNSDNDDDDDDDDDESHSLSLSPRPPFAKLTAAGADGDAADGAHRVNAECDRGTRGRTEYREVVTVEEEGQQKKKPGKRKPPVHDRSVAS